MKNRISLIGVVIGAIALTAAFEYSRAQPMAAPAASTSKIGVVSLSGVFNKCQSQAQYRKQVDESAAKSRADLDVLTKQVETEKAQINTLKPGSSDYLKQVQSYLEKQAQLEARTEYLKQQRSVEDRQWFEKLYAEILKIVPALAQEKKLDLVLERTEPSLSSAQSGDQLMTMVQTHKVLYSSGCVDLTDEVVARLDASVKPQN
jgi:Skp family chaperone for outer membrane proteins